MKKIPVFFLAFSLLFSVFSCRGPVGETTDSGVSGMKSFTDSLGREIFVPENISKIAVSGSVSQIVVLSLCPEKLVGLSGALSETQKKYFDGSVSALPVLGHLYGGKGELNPEALLATGAELVLDIGETKESMKEDFDSLSKQTSIPFLHIDAALENMDQVYSVLGTLLGVSEKAESLSKYYRENYRMISKIAEKTDKYSVLLLSGKDGLNVAPKNSANGEVLDLLCDNTAELDSVFGKGDKNVVDMEQILSWDPEYLFFTPDSVYEKAARDPVWQKLRAVQSGRIYEVPAEPFNFLGYPASSQRILGLLYLSNVLYPEQCDFDLRDKVTEYYRLFYGYELSEEEYRRMVK